jgi:hypothetical protein
MTGRDYQRSRLYAWERRTVAPADRSSIRYDDAQGMVNAIWFEQGLRYPPRVERLPRQSRALVADASRLTIRLPERLSSWCLLHEIAHAMSSTYDGLSDGHGPVFVGLYVKLLTEYLRLDPALLRGTLQDAGVQAVWNARAMFLDR